MSTAADDDRRHKDLRDELQLYWLIQLGSITALGALMGTWPKGADATSGDSILVKMIIAAVALVLITIAGMYNVVGNYYTFVANYRLGRVKQQESVVTPWMALAQSLIATFLGGAIGAVTVEGIALFSVPSANAAPKEVVGLAVDSPTVGSKFSVTWNRTDFIVQEREMPEPANHRVVDRNSGVGNNWFRSFVVIGAGLMFGFAVYGWSVAKAIESFEQQRAGADQDTLAMLTDFIEYSKELQKVWAIGLGKRIRSLQKQCTNCMVDFRRGGPLSPP